MIVNTLERKPKFLGLEIGRGVAAALVAMHHAGLFVVTIDHARAAPFKGVTDQMHVGVDFFFVLSGFLITWIHWADIGQRNRLKGYFLKRFARIYPTYWCILIPLIAMGALSGRDDILRVFTSVLLLSGPEQQILGVAWTLTFEVLFYLSFGLVILGGRWAAFALPAWAIVILVNYAISGDAAVAASFFLNLVNLEFLTGVAAALILRRFKIPLPGLVLAVGLLIFFGATFLKIGAMFPPASLTDRMIFGISSSLIVLGIVEVDRSGKFTYPKWLVLFGTASYSVYLVHSLVEAGAAKLLRHYTNLLTPDIITVAITAFGIFTGILFHVVVERRITHQVQILISSRQRKLMLVRDAPG